MKKYTFILFLCFFCEFLYAAWPMESIDRYNVVLIHGAADRYQGMDCADSSYLEAFKYTEKKLMTLRLVCPLKKMVE